MKLLYASALIVILFACSRSHRQYDFPSAPKPEDFPVDSLLKFKRYYEIIDMYSAGYDQKDHEKYEKSLHGAMVHTANGLVPMGEISHVSLGMVDAAEMPRMTTEIPNRWQTRAGLYVGMPLDSVQLLNKAEFTITKGSPYFYAQDWNNGQLTNQNTDAFFSIDTQEPLPNRISSQEIISKGLKVRVKGIIVWKPEVYELSRLLRNNFIIPGDYPQASTRLLTFEDVVEKDSIMLCHMRNEIFARKGYVFSTPVLAEYFSNANWYQPVNRTMPKLTPIETANVNFITAREKFMEARGPLVESLRHSLPLLSLPLDLETREVFIDRLRVGVRMPNGEITNRDQYPAVWGMLADTSRFYMVIWQAPILRSSGDYIHVIKITTLDKRLRRPITTATLQVRHDSYTNSSTCKDEPKYTSTINADLSFKSVYSAKVKCTGDNSPRDEVHTVSGQINKDGTVRVDETDEEFFKGR